MSALGPRGGLHCGTRECLQATLPVSCTVSLSLVNIAFHYAVDITLCTGRSLYCLFVPRVQTTLAKYSFFLFPGNANLEFTESYFVHCKKT